mmetsp:Transcript_14957/g.16926  ORF Transcript_14957/g.16926 Transcript_14957/m.16926 type:complete len:115 (-) Transcript_14957:762-1106(-)
MEKATESNKVVADQETFSTRMETNDKKRAVHGLANVALKANEGKDLGRKEEPKGESITLFCKDDFVNYLFQSKQTLMKEEEERRERDRKSMRKSINSMTEAEQLKLALEMSMKE